MCVCVCLTKTIGVNIKTNLTILKFLNHVVDKRNE